MDQPVLRMTVGSYNQIPAALRKTVDAKRFVRMGTGEWRLVEFIKA
jgi:hypothetical protein